MKHHHHCDIPEHLCPDPECDWDDRNASTCPTCDGFREVFASRDVERPELDRWYACPDCTPIIYRLGTLVDARDEFFNRFDLPKDHPLWGVSEWQLGAVIDFLLGRG